MTNVVPMKTQEDSDEDPGREAFNKVHAQYLKADARAGTNSLLTDEEMDTAMPRAI